MGGLSGKAGGAWEVCIQPEAHRGAVMNLFNLKRIVKRFAGWANAAEEAMTK
jgi:hypothetical protein